MKQFMFDQERTLMHAGNMPSHSWVMPEALSNEDELRGYTRSGYYFYDETEAYVVGPFATFELAEYMRLHYDPSSITGFS